MCPNTAIAVVRVKAGVDNDGKCIIDYSPFKKNIQSRCSQGLSAFCIRLQQGHAVVKRTFYHAVLTTRN